MYETQKDIKQALIRNLALRRLIRYPLSRSRRLPLVRETLIEPGVSKALPHYQRHAKSLSPQECLHKALMHARRKSDGCFPPMPSYK